jgi:hypothetical protein
MAMPMTHDEWQRWRRERARQLQRERRAGMRRIDFYADATAATVIDSLRTRRAGGDASSILNRIIAEWLDLRHRRAPELNRPE